MPRRSREQSATGIYHVMLRGINRYDIFEDTDDYRMFLRILGHLVFRQDNNMNALPPLCTIYCYCLMNNHVHLLIREREEGISEIMKRIGVSYARYYNEKYERSGPLFQDRFRSEAVNSIEYFMTLLRYIHQNPVKAGLVKDVRDYKWSSWAEYENQSSTLGICDVRVVLNRLDSENVYEWVTTPVNEVIIDIDNDSKFSVTDDDLKTYINGKTGLTASQGVASMPKQQRKETIQNLFDYCKNMRQIARVTELPYGVVYRICNKE